MTRPPTIIAAAIVLATSMMALPARAGSGDEAAIRALESRFAAAVNAKDIDAIMKVYVPDESLLVFDVVPPRQYAGAKAYRKDWEGFLALFKDAPKFEVTDLNVVAVGPLGYGHSIQRVSGTNTKGQPIDLTVRGRGTTAADPPRLPVAARRDTPVHLLRQAGGGTGSVLRGASPHRLDT